MFRLQDAKHDLKLIIVSEFQKDPQSLSDKLILRTLKETPKKLAEQICQAVSFLHSKNIIHQDIRANNILVEDTHDGKHNIKIADTSIQCITSLIPHKFTIKSRYSYISKHDGAGEEEIKNDSGDEYAKIACKKGCIALKYDTAYHYAPELFEQMFVHGDELQRRDLDRWNDGLHSGTSAAESKLITSLKLVYNEKTDLFAFGTVLFHLFSGKLPWHGHNPKDSNLEDLSTHLSIEQIILFRMIYNKQGHDELTEKLNPLDSFDYTNCIMKTSEQRYYNQSEILDIIKRCWKPESERNDSFKDIQECLKNLEEDEDYKRFYKFSNKI